MLITTNRVPGHAESSTGKRPAVAALPALAVLSLLAVLAVLAVGGAAPAFATPGGYPPSPCARLFVSTTIPSPGQEILVTGSGFGAHQTVTLVLHSPTVALVATTTDNSGNFAIPVTIPDSPTGPRLLTAEGGSAGCPASEVQLDIESAAAPAAGRRVPEAAPAATGASIATALGIALTLIVGGLLFARAGRGNVAAGRES
jgi:hypothetical protein